MGTLYKSCNLESRVEYNNLLHWERKIEKRLEEERVEKKN